MKRHFLSYIAGSSIALSLLAACEPIVAERGNTVDDANLSKISTRSSKDDVYQALGSPTTIGPFGDNTWYYMGQRTEQEAFFDPVVTNRKIVEVDFNDDDKVATIKQYNMDNSESVDMVQATSPAEGLDTSLAEDLFGRGAASSKDKKKKDTQ